MNRHMYRATYVVVCLLAGCSGGRDTEFSYFTPSQAQLQGVLDGWNARDLDARDVELVYKDDSHAGYALYLYQHTVAGKIHYGVVTKPTSEPDVGFPVIVVADGLDQSNPTMDAASWAKNAHSLLDKAVFIVPLFRGRTLLYNGISLSADGDFCDAYDGATDDTIAFMNVVEAEIQAADFSRVMVRGGSRGGNVALLIGIRDPRVTVVAAVSAPTDFYRREVRDRYGLQYQCQFIEGKSTEESRRRMLGSSPLHFPMLPNVETVYLDHGEEDEIVPLWNAEDIYNRLINQGVHVYYDAYPALGHDIGSNPNFQAKRNLIFDDFLAW